MNENSLSLLPSQNDFQFMQVIAENAVKSGLYAGVGSKEKIFMVLLAAREMGIPAMQALNGGIWNIQGKIEISARLMSSMIRRAGHNINIIQCDSKVCVLEGKRKDNGDTFKSQFTIEDAQKAGLSSRDVWKKYTEDMLYNRALSRLGRRLFADVIGTAYIEGEIRDAEFEVVEPKQFAEESNQVQFEEDENKIKTLYDRFPKEDKEYLDKYFVYISDTYNKSHIQIANAAETNFEKFDLNFNTWKVKFLSEQG